MPSKSQTSIDHAHDQINLFKNDQIVAFKEANKKFAIFKQQDVGIYQAIAEMPLEDGSVVQATSNKINMSPRHNHARCAHRRKKRPRMCIFWLTMSSAIFSK
jgi:hypothetical protein